MDKDRVYLIHILNSIKLIQEYILKMDFEDFLKARLVQDGVIRQLEIIG